MDIREAARVQALFAPTQPQAAHDRPQADRPQEPRP